VIESAEPTRTGFVYVAMLFALAIFGLGLAKLGQCTSERERRDRETQLLRTGQQVVEAIHQYIHPLAGHRQRFPRSFADLIEDRRYIGTVRHLRSAPLDPITLSAQWGYVRTADGGFSGVYSLSRAVPLAQRSRAAGTRLPAASRYSDWRFVYDPATDPSCRLTDEPIRMRYQIRLFDPASGEVRQTVAEAADESSLRSTLGATGKVVVGLRPRGGATRLLARARPKQFDVGLVCMELSRLLRAGLTLPRQWRRNSDGCKARRAPSTRVSRRACSRASVCPRRLRLAGTFPPVLIAAVRASERSGRVPEALEEFARYDASLRELRRKTINAAIYPSLVVGFGFLVVALPAGLRGASFRADLLRAGRADQRRRPAG